MADIKKAILQKKVEGVLYDLMLQTQVDNVVYSDDGTTKVYLSTKLAEILAKTNALGAMANKGEITYADLAAALKTLIDGKAGKGTTLLSYGITDAYTKAQVDGLVAGVLHFKGTKDYQSLLPATGNADGDVWLVKYTGTSGTTAWNAEFLWNSTAWECLGTTADLSAYVTTAALTSGLAGKVNTTVKVNGKALSGDVTLGAGDVGAATTAQGAKADSALQPAGDGSNLTATFTQAASRANLASGEKVSVIFGKLMKWFADLKAVAFSGAYSDLTGAPSSLPANGGDADTVDGKHASDFATTAAATTSVNGLMSGADKTKLDGIATGANNYSHPTGDGNLHVPATGTTNNGKVLKSGSTAGSAAWGTLSASDVGAAPATHTHTAAQVSDAVPNTRKVNGKALSADVTLGAGDVGAVPTARTVNGKALSADVSLAAGDVGAVPTSRTVNGKALSGNIALTPEDVGASRVLCATATPADLGVNDLFIQLL